MTVIQIWTIGKRISMKHILSILSTEGKIEFINDHLIGSAKADFSVRPAELKKTEDIFKIIEDPFKCKTLLLKFVRNFTRKSRTIVKHVKHIHRLS